MKIEGVRGDDWKCLLWQLLDGSIFNMVIKVESPHGGYIFEDITCSLSTMGRNQIVFRSPPHSDNKRYVAYLMILSIETIET